MDNDILYFIIIALTSLCIHFYRHAKDQDNKAKHLRQIADWALEREQKVKDDKELLVKCFSLSDNSKMSINELITYMCLQGKITFDDSVRIKEIFNIINNG